MRNLERPASSEEKIEEELTPEEAETQAAIQQTFLVSVENTLLAKISDEAEPIPGKKRELEPVIAADGREIGKVERIRKPEQREVGGQDLWLVVDFDDVLNHTTEFNRDLHEKLAETTGMPLKEVERIYDQSKEENEEGKKVFRFTKFVEQVKTESKDPKTVDKVIKSIDYGKYVDKAVKRALIASRFRFGEAIRVSILTFGDPKYQKLRIDKTDVSSFADDIIYTEGSKRETLQAMMEEYRRNDPPHHNEIAAPFIITVDDSPEQVDDYEKLPVDSRFANMRFSHPQAKRYGKPHAGKEVIVSDETAPNEAAVNIYKATRIATSQNAQEDRSRLYKILHNPKDYDGILSNWGGYQREEDIRYQMKGKSIVRTSRKYTYKEDWDKGSPVTRDYGPVLPDGSLKKGLTGDTDVYWEEFIKQ